MSEPVSPPENSASAEILSEKTHPEIVPPAVSSYYRIKHIFDIAVVVITLPVIGTIILLFMLLVKLTSKGPIFYSQVRCSKGEKPFKMYKIRSMIVDAEKHGIVWSKGTDIDPRITTVGRIMRRLHIDEMPQIWNVLRGEMDVIGPRPERPEFIKKLKEQIPYYEYRMLVRPGLTGYAQINWKADTGLEDVHRKVILDLEYIENANPWLDFRILLGTASQFLPARYFGKLPLRLCGIYRPAEQSPWADKVGLLDEHLSVHLCPNTIQDET
jgi:lipopolysaccharide/colanic/teichoic acid biosynthesis glycosyltransferase